jgi:hypothetical protein
VRGLLRGMIRIELHGSVVILFLAFGDENMSLLWGRVLAGIIQGGF